MKSAERLQLGIKAGLVDVVFFLQIHMHAKLTKSLSFAEFILTWDWKSCTSYNNTIYTK